MNTLLSLLLVAVGLAIILGTVATRRSRAQEFPRFRAPATAGGRLLPLLLGVIITACGAGLFVLLRTG